MHFSVLQMEKEAAAPVLKELPQFPEWQSAHPPKQKGALAPVLIEEWKPEDPVFWNEQGRKIASRNLWLSIPALFLSFAVWMVWSVVVAKLPQVGFDYTTRPIGCSGSRRSLGFPGQRRGCSILSCRQFSAAGYGPRLLPGRS
jgi:hypothetical protein